VSDAFLGREGSKTSEWAVNGCFFFKVHQSASIHDKCYSQGSGGLCACIRLKEECHVLLGWLRVGKPCIQGELSL